ncbi:MAG: hypothetical protein QME16_07280, partial [Planctomycetota bacterium]|nr:hypothetical protein [Planctomycetota bacterium]
LDEAHTAEYIKHRLKVSAGDKNVFHLFPEEVCGLIYKYTKGFPREINHICDLALLDGFIKQEKSITASITESVARDLEMAYT